jgi:hypothetical protein
VRRKRQPSARDQRIVELRTRGLTLEAIAQEVGLTRERVRQITNGYHIARRFTTIPELMARFGVTPYVVMKAIEAAELDHQKIRQGRTFVFTDAHVRKIVPHLDLDGVRECMICGKSFDVRGRSRKRLCSPECFVEHRRRMREFTPGEERPMSETMREIHDLLSAEPPGSTWIGFTEALRLTGMKKMQLTWLRWRGLIACVPSDKRTRFGTVQMLYSARHCDVLRRFLAGR